MGWLRRDKDCIALVVVWALLLQAAIVSFTSGAMAASLASGDSIVLCTTRGAVVDRQLPGQNHQKSGCQCCTMACRIACGATYGGIVPVEFQAPLPALIEARAERPQIVERCRQPADASAAQPRAPPLG
jgi:hypothetical protein